MQHYYLAAEPRLSASSAAPSSFRRGVALRPDEVKAWRQGLSTSADDYGLSREEYDALADSFAAFASRGTRDAKPGLIWRAACRVLRFHNYPNHPDDVKDLFDTAKQTRESGSITLRALCLWIVLNRRSPLQWYNMTAARYTHMLRVAHVLDSEKTGLFTLDQARILADDFFERDVPNGE